MDQAWQQALAVEFRAIFGYSLLGPHLSEQVAVALAQADQSEHMTLRDETSARMLATGLQPVAPQADYPQLYPVETAASAQRLAISLESDAATAWRFAYATAAAQAGLAATSLRGLAQLALTGSAVRATRWRITAGDATTTVAFPGI